MPILEDVSFDSYHTYLREQYRSPSKGGNTGALHAHVIVIEGKSYSFLALGTKQWAYRGDIISFEYEENGQYLNIVRESFKSVDRSGKEIVRGNRGFKKTLRTASQRLPARRSEW